MLADQAASSLGNFVAGGFAAHFLTSPSFGLFSILSVVYIVALGLFRSALCEVVVVASNSRTELEESGSVDAAVDGTLIVSGALCLLVLATSLLVGANTLGYILPALGLVSMLVQDALRIAAIAKGAAHVAFLSDVAWLCLMPLAMLLAAFLDPTVSTFFSAWAFASLPSVVYSSIVLRWRPCVKSFISFVSSNGTLVWSCFVDWLLRQGMSQSLMYGFALLSGPLAVGSIRACQLLLGPLNVVFTGVQLSVLPSAARTWTVSPDRTAKSLRRMSAGLAVSAVGMAGILTVLPSSLLRIAVGQQVATALEYLLPMSCTLAASGLMSAGSIGLRVARSSRSLVIARISTCLVVATASVGSYFRFETVIAAQWGVAFGSILSVSIWEFQLQRSVRSTQSIAEPYPGSAAE